jgi:hypothetical protein
MIPLVSIVVPYHNRPDHLELFLREHSRLDPKYFEIVVQDEGIDENGFFNTGRCQNNAIEKSQAEWIMKVDVDCLPSTLELYNSLIPIVMKNDVKDYRIFGVEYLNARGQTLPYRFCGNEYFFSKESWKKVGGVPEFPSYGYEDYAFEYSLEKNRNPDFVIDGITEDNASNMVRDNLTMVKNKESLPYYYFHRFHNRQTFNKGTLDLNRKSLYNHILNLNASTINGKN